MASLDEIFNSDEIREQVLLEKRSYMFKLVLSIGTLYGNLVKDVSPYKHLKVIFKLFPTQFEMTLKENCFEHIQNYNNHETIVVEFDMKRQMSPSVALSLLQSIALLFNCSKHIKHAMFTEIRNLVPEKNRSQLCVAHLHRRKSNQVFRLDNLMRALAYVKIEKNIFVDYDMTLSNFVNDSNRLLKFIFNESLDFKKDVEKWLAYQIRH